MVNETGEEVENIKRRPGSEPTDRRSGYAKKRAVDEGAHDTSAAATVSNTTPILLGVTAVAIIGAALLWRARRPTLASRIATAVERFGQPKESLAFSFFKQAAIPIVTSLLQRAARDQFGRVLDVPPPHTDASPSGPV